MPEDRAKYLPYSPEAITDGVIILWGWMNADFWVRIPHNKGNGNSVSAELRELSEDDLGEIGFALYMEYFFAREFALGGLTDRFPTEVHYYHMHYQRLMKEYFDGVNEHPIYPSDMSAFDVRRLAIISAIREARDQINLKSVRDILCSKLEKQKGDLKEIVKILSTVALALFGVHHVDPIVLSIMSLIMAKGIDRFCEEEDAPAISPATIMVYVNVDSKSYHLKTCRHCNATLKEMDLASAKEISLPCKICKPQS